MNGTRCGFVALVGAPNAGKSTLLNLMVGGKVSIVTPKVQTTRSRITGICMPGDRTPIIFLVTPGIFTPQRRPALRREPDTPVHRRRHIMRTRPGRHRERFHPQVLGRYRHSRDGRRCRKGFFRCGRRHRGCPGAVRVGARRRSRGFRFSTLSHPTAFASRPSSDTVCLPTASASASRLWSGKQFPPVSQSAYTASSRRRWRTPDALFPSLVPLSGPARRTVAAVGPKCLSAYM